MGAFEDFDRQASAMSFEDFDRLAGVPPKDTRSGVTRLYQDYLAKPATRVASFAANQLTEPLVAAERVWQGEPIGQVAKSYVTPGGIADSYRRSAAMPNPLAEVAVPQTPLQAGAMAGTGGASRILPALSKVSPALGRIVGGAAGGEVGNQLERGPTGLGAAVGGGGAAAGEGLGALMNRLRLALPGGKAATNRADAARIGQTVEDIVPELGGVRTTEGIRAMTEGGGQAALGQAKEGTTRAIEGALPRPGTRVEVPALGPREGTGTGPAYGGTGPSRPIYDVTGAPTGQTPYRPATGGNPPDTSYTLREANQGLTDIGEGAFNQNILDRTAKKAADRRLYGRVTRDISSGLETAGGPEAASAFEAGQSAYSSGSKILDFFKKSGVVDSDGFLNVPKMQRLLNNPKNAATLQRALGPEDFERLSSAVFRGAARGETDRMTSGMGGSLDALMQVLRGQNTGAAQYARIPIATLLPNLGSKYVGRNPLAIPETLRAILDVGAQRGTGRIVDEP